MTYPTEVANIMNDFYVNIASQIGGQINLNQEESTNVEFVARCAEHFKDHPNVELIRDIGEKQDFKFVHTDPSTVEKIIKDLNTGKATGCDSIPVKACSVQY